MGKGNYIIFEGGDATGTTTHSKMLYNFLTEKKIPCIWTREPGGTDLGREIRTILLNNREITIPPLSELFLYEADRVKQYETIVKPNIEKRINVISDRSWPSTDAYQGAAGKVNINLIRRLNKIATFRVKPDLLFIIDGDPKELLKKETNPDRFSEKGLEYHQKVRKGYLDILKKYSEFAVKIDYRKDDIESMQEEIRNYVDERLEIF